MGDTNLHERLQSLRYQPEQALTARKEISVSEKGKRYRLSFDRPLQSVVYQIDGSIITEGSKCDKMILVDKTNGEWTQIFVELKGKDVKHAITQLESTLQNEFLRHAANKEKRARIVATAYPANGANLTMERAKIRFRKDYQCELRPLKPDQPDAPIKI
jgi:hypothetical protein